MLLSTVAPVAMPDLAEFSLHKISYDVDFEDVAVPGLCGAFYRCPDGGRILSVGIYMMDGVELFRAWGHTDDDHCAYHTVTCVDGSVDGPHLGCPDVRVIQEGAMVVGLEIHTKSREYYINVTPQASTDRGR